MTDLITNKQDVLKGRKDIYNYYDCSKERLETLNLAIDEQIKLLTDFIEFSEIVFDELDKREIIIPALDNKTISFTNQLNDLIKAREDGN